MKIAIEGLDGSGKTTVAKYISDYYKISYVDKSFKYILGKYDEEIDLTNDEIKKYEKTVCRYDDSLIKAMYYGLGNIYDLRHRIEDVVIDRYLGSNYFWNGDDSTELLFSIFAEASSNNVLTIILNASLEERTKRIRKRDFSDKDLQYKELRVDNCDKIINFYKKYNLPVFIIDVDNKSIDEVNKEVISVIEGYRNEKNI